MRTGAGTAAPENNNAGSLGDTILKFGEEKRCRYNQEKMKKS